MVCMPKKSFGDNAAGRKPSAADFMPDDRSLPSLKHAAEHCQGCELYKDATQTVFGEGSVSPQILFVGEQPGDMEDKAGHPFVGPAGKLLDRALEAADLQRAECYFTNTVKHFKFEWRGKRRLHKTPRQIEINACLPWLRAEINTVKPDVIVLLGATAAKAVFGKDFKITQQRGQLLQSDLAPKVMATVHPSSILRAIDDESRERELEEFIADLKFAKTLTESCTESS
ncbi:MAG TPA: UdgX family uracil-DNA binding protein [Drouetiella sp.]|jgi:uracil-DNA glycosylase